MDWVEAIGVSVLIILVITVLVLLGGWMASIHYAVVSIDKSLRLIASSSRALKDD